ncbi:MAG: hypothetical protein NTX97_02375, partial [Bacteroidetes bacterium]|nr:hypothetical protein [Bacteroidota bacterium]
MEKVLLYIISAPLLLGLWFGNTPASVEKKVFFNDTIPVKKDSLSVNACLKCHEKLVDKKVPHKPVKNDCAVCHQSNGQEHP